jgi:branched-chain amino acid transport system ATP-binding protein
MLEVREVRASYGDLPALLGASLTVHPGEIVALIGPNGAGKTTLLRTISGLHRATAGQITWEGTAIERARPHRIVEAGIVLVPEGRRLFTGMSVLENLEMGAFTARARAERAMTLQWACEIFPRLAERRAQIASTLSGGEQQMVAIGRALMGLPRLLMLDEPSLGLAPRVVQDIFGVIRLINERGVAVLLVEQNARMALELAQTAYVMEQGRIVNQGSGQQFLSDEEVRAAYLGYAEERAR